MLEMSQDYGQTIVTRGNQTLNNNIILIYKIKQNKILCITILQIPAMQYHKQIVKYVHVNFLCIALIVS
jgi:hypothetical protein